MKWNKYNRRTNVTAPKRSRASTLLMTLVYVLMFGALASSMVAFSQGNMKVQQAQTDANQALVAAESGMSYLLLQFRHVGLPAIKEGSIDKTTPNATALWSGSNIESITFAAGTPNPNNNGIAKQLTSAFNASGAYTGTVTAPTGTNPLNIPAIKLDSTNSKATFTLSIAWDAANPHIVTAGSYSYVVLKCTSTGTCNNISRSVSMDVWVQKILSYAVYSNVAIQLGKNVRIQGDIASTYVPPAGAKGKGPPIQMVSDFHYIANTPGIDNDLATLRGLLSSYDNTHTNRLNVMNPSSSGAIAAKNAGLKDLNADGYIDDFDVGLKNFDDNGSTTNPHDNNISKAEFINPNTGKKYDDDLFSLIDSPRGTLDGSGNLPNGETSPWNGYNDDSLDYKDNYAKVNGNVKMKITYSEWQAHASLWQQWGDLSGGTAGTTLVDQFEGPVISTDPNPVQFGNDFSDEQVLAPTDFDTSSYDAKIPSGNATKSGTTISGGTLTLAMADKDGSGNTVYSVETTPASATSGWQATYKRPVFTGITFSNVRIPKGLNAKFVNCVFNGGVSVKMNTNIVTGGSVQSGGTISGGTTTTDQANGKTWAQRMISGSFDANTALTSSNSVAYTQGNNLRFTGCTFNCGLTADVPTAYTHFADSWEFDGNTTFNNTTSDKSYSMIAPQTNIEIGSYVAPSSNPSTLVGVVVAGNIDIRGTTNVDGSLLVTGDGAGNTTLGYFGTTDQGQAVPSLSELPSGANGSYGHLYFKNNPGRGMPNGIVIPVVATPQTSTYQIN